MNRERILDVSDLAPPEPMHRVLTALGTLAPGERLRVLLHREPFPLYGMLAAQGFQHRTEPHRTGEGSRAAFAIVIWSDA